MPEPGDPQAWDRYAYALNVPIRYTDPTGHWYYDPGCECLVYTGVSWNEHPENLHYVNTASLRPYFPDVPSTQIEEFDPLTQAVLGNISEPVDWMLLYGQCRTTGCSWIEVGITLLPIIPAGRLLDDIIPSGQWHHIISARIERALKEHPTLSGIFDRYSLVIQAANSMGHKGYQAWHRGYDDEVVIWLRSVENISATPEDFAKFLQEIYSDPAMQERFPGTLQLLQMLLEELQ